MPRPADPAIRPQRLLVLLSGSGRTLENLLGRIAEGALPARVVRVIGSRPCRGVEVARQADIPAEVIAGEIPAGELARIAAESEADWIVLAGYLRRVNIPTSPRDYTGRVVNIHPALLPRHGGPGMYGGRVHAAVLAAGETESGCTVHLADANYDEGPIVLQMRCPVLEGDTAETLAARVFELEKQAYPEALRMLFARAAAEERS
ncbi:MAG: phosphoribosylglycinamide formyltransferase [Phycisphaerales bacterium JB039]